MHRRALFQTAAIAGLAAAAGAARAQDQDPADQPEPQLPQLTDPGELRGEMLYRRFGQTGETVSAIGFGGSHFAKKTVTEAESIRLCHEAIDRGITFMDNSWDYNKGLSEERMGAALAQGNYRNRVFLMTKVDGRDQATAAHQLEDSLLRLRTDHIDLWQFHETLRYEDPDRIFGDDGAIHAALAARKAGKIRFIGFTGHKDPHIHLYMLAVARQHGFKFDAVLHPSNVMDGHFRSFARNVMPVALREGIAVQTMKPLGGGDGIILKSGTVTAMECLHYALNLPTSVVITGIDNQKALDQAFAAAKTFKPMSPAAVDAILAKTAKVAPSGDYELFKTSERFDSTAQNPAWLGKPRGVVDQLAPPNSG
jgi:predicted aldo/keto reductase-like oxidoreductase